MRDDALGTTEAEAAAAAGIRFIGRGLIFFKVMNGQFHINLNPLFIMLL